MAATRSRHSSTAFYRGDSGRAKADEELAKAKAAAEARKEKGNDPFRFRVAVGGSTEFVILDDAPDFYRFEHNLKNPNTGYWDTFTGCVKEWDNCPVCDVSGKESYYALYFSVLDFTEFKTRDGQTHEFSRKLLVVKPAQQKKFLRAFAKAEKEGRTLRGAIFETTRDGDKDPSIGNDIEFVEFMEEDELRTYTRTWKDREGKKHTEDCSEPYDYEKMFTEPTTEELRREMGADPAPGSRAHEDKALGRRGSTRGRGSSEEEGEDWDKAERTERMTTRKRGRSEPEEEQEDEAPRRGRGATRTRGKTEEPPPRASRRSSREEPDDDPEEPEEEPPRRGSGRQEAPRRAATGRGKRDDDDLPLDEGEDDTPPRTPGVGRRAGRGR